MLRITTKIPTRGFSYKLDLTSVAFINKMHLKWQKDPTSVESSWQACFSGKDVDLPTDHHDENKQMLSEILQIVKNQNLSYAAERSSKEAVQIGALLDCYECVGHLVADLDPLRLQEHYKDYTTFNLKFRFAAPIMLQQLDHKAYGFTEADLEREFHIDMPYKSRILSLKKQWQLKEIINAYQIAYCGKIGVEFKHIPERDVCDWIRWSFEGIQFKAMSREEKLKIYDRLNWTHEWGEYLTEKFKTMKRFGIEGCESFIPGLKCVIDSAMENGGTNFIIGMPHRGRLNVLCNVLRKPMEAIMAEFQYLKPSN